MALTNIFLADIIKAPLFILRAELVVVDVVVCLISEMDFTSLLT